MGDDKVKSSSSKGEDQSVYLSFPLSGVKERQDNEPVVNSPQEVGGALAEMPARSAFLGRAATKAELRQWAGSPGRQCNYLLGPGRAGACRVRQGVQSEEERASGEAM